MPTARAPSETEVPELIGFLDQHLRPGTGWSIAAEYPSVFNPTNIENLRIITEDNKILAHAAIRYSVIKSTAGLFKVAAIGSVLTEPNFRNRGLSQEILSNAIQSAQKECADFAILWTDLYDFYRKLGFELAGTEISLTIQAIPTDIQAAAQAAGLSLKGTKPYRKDLKFVKGEKVAPEAILKLYSGHTCATIRTVEDIRKSLQIPNSHIYTAWGPDNQILAYAVEGKGADLKGYVHEWGGQLDCLIPLLAYVFKDLNAPPTILTPKHAENLRAHLQAWGATEHQGYLGMIMPVCMDAFFMKIKRHARNNGVSDLILEKSADGFRVGRGKDVVTLTTLQEVTRLIFGPIPNDSLSKDYEKVFPIQMWIWGWDSV